jgi:hypothetical protein
VVTFIKPVLYALIILVYWLTLSVREEKRQFMEAPTPLQNGLAWIAPGLFVLLGGADVIRWWRNWRQAADEEVDWKLFVAIGFACMALWYGCLPLVQ